MSITRVQHIHWSDGTPLFRASREIRSDGTDTNNDLAQELRHCQERNDFRTKGHVLQSVRLVRRAMIWILPLIIQPMSDMDWDGFGRGGFSICQCVRYIDLQGIGIMRGDSFSTLRTWAGLDMIAVYSHGKLFATVVGVGGRCIVLVILQALL